MILFNLKKAPSFEVRSWLEKNIKELTPYQKECLWDDDFLRCSPFEFYKKRKKINNPFLRLTIIFIPIVYMILLIGLPFNFIVTGRWGYKPIEFIIKWFNSCGL